MTVPKRIPITREAGYRTDTIGRFDGGLFYANGWGKHAFVHLFDLDGSYRESTVVRVEDRAELSPAVDRLVEPLPGKEFGDIAVGLFEFEFDGVRFGLIDESGDRYGDGTHVDWVELCPDRLGFHEPWDGLYDT